MLGRQTEVSLVEGLIRSARSGSSGALVLTGAPGIGKSAVLAHARRFAGGDRVLATTAVEAEARLPFAGLADLLAPVIDRIGELPDPQARALRGALALGPPAPGDRFHAYAATLSLLAAAAADGPVVCLVDDAHWLDAESLEAIAFAARRLEAEGIAVIIAAREAPGTGTQSAALPRHRIRGLDPEDAVALIEARAALTPAPAVTRRLVGAAGGNPTALIELAAHLSPAQLAGREPLPDPLPVGEDLGRALLAPTLALPPETRRALLVLSADDGAGDLLAFALDGHGLAMSHLEPAERGGLIVVGPSRTDFSHPLVRAAVYASAAPPERRRAHRVLAAAAARLGDAHALDRRAWHLAMAATGADEAVAAELEEAAARAARRSGYAVASDALETAARLTPEARERGRRLLESARLALAAGGEPRAGMLLQQVVGLDADRAQVTDAVILQGHVETFAGSARRAIDMVVAAADRDAAVAPADAASLLVQAILACHLRADIRLGTALAERAVALAAGAPPAVAARVEAAAAATSTYAGRVRAVSARSARELDRQAEAGDRLGTSWAVSRLHVMVITERYAEAEAGLDAIVGGAREHGRTSALAFPLTVRADLRMRVGPLEGAVADAEEAIRLADETDQRVAAAYAAATLARVEALLGRPERCQAAADRALDAVGRSDAEVLRLHAGSALGHLALSRGEFALALAHLVPVAARAREGGVLHPLFIPFRQDLVEARIRLGQSAEAAADLDDIEARAARAGALWAVAAAARCRGLMAGEDDHEGHFASAMELHARSATPLQRARTELCLGERRRRARRVRDARGPLARALETFEALGAQLWAEWARRELRAAGSRPREPRAAPIQTLTPQELQVALAVSRGATNKEAAAALLISPKTVEHHLGRVYAKLGVHTRAALAHRLSRAATREVPADGERSPGGA